MISSAQETTSTVSAGSIQFFFYTAGGLVFHLIQQLTLFFMVDCWYSIELNLSYCCVKLNGPLCIQKLNFLMASSEISWFKLSCTDHMSLKYLTVLTLSSRVASHTILVFLCCWKADTVHMWLTPSSMALYSAQDFAMLVIRARTSVASITVPTPTVRACLGTASIFPPKNRALAMKVSFWVLLLQFQSFCNFLKNAPVYRAFQTFCLL